MNFNTKVQKILTESNWTNAIVTWQGPQSDDVGEYIVTRDYGDSVDMEPTSKVERPPTAPKTEYWLKRIPKDKLILSPNQR
jgi:hypothetical protein